MRQTLLMIFLAAAATAAAQNPSTYLRPYDTSTLEPGKGAVLLPYNRLINPAGTILKFGNDALENHSLDAVLLPGGNVLAVEDRYGVAFVKVPDNKLVYHLDFGKDFGRSMSTYSGIKTYTDGDGQVHVLWSAAGGGKSYLMDALCEGDTARIVSYYAFLPEDPSPLALPNDIAVSTEDGQLYVYIVLNGNSRLRKLRWSDRSQVWEVPTGMAPFGLVLAQGKVYVSNWAGPVPPEGTPRETAGIPYGKVFIDPRTGATAEGSVSVFNAKDGTPVKEIPVGLHPNAILASPDGQTVFVSNGNSDDVTLISTASDVATDSIAIRLAGDDAFIGDSPDGLAIDPDGKTLYVSAGMDNAVAVVSLADRKVRGFIPTEAYPAGLVVSNGYLYVCNLEGEGASVPNAHKAYNTHHQQATLSVIPIPNDRQLRSYTSWAKANNFVFRTALTRLPPRTGVRPVPVPERIGEPSLFKHVIYIIKENRTYDQVLGDMPEGNGSGALCMYGDTVTPNQHKIARNFLLLDNYYASGKCSAEGHQWTDQGMVDDYIEKNVRAWFRSYPHVQTDAMAYDKEGFIWNDALDHGKSVRIYGEATTVFVNGSQNWLDIYGLLARDQPLSFFNTTTISRVRPILDTLYPGFDGPPISDQFRANAFIQELRDYEKMPGDQWPQLMILALPCDHTDGTSPNVPTPEAMVADNDLALGRIIDAVSQSRFWDSTAIFVTEDDSQAGWDHVSAYRTTGFIVSPYSRLHKTIHTNYNQVSLLRTVEQILGIPPMNMLDATAVPMTDCFDTAAPDLTAYRWLPNRVPLDKMNPAVATLTGKAKRYAQLSASPQFAHIDGGDDDLLNHILWFAAMGNKPYPKWAVSPKSQRKDKD
ncbi:MAG TPA: alkaline phosphatase family protein [Dinghuibacter sp.]|uniref:alkaline phosphatase family protein n=1 Tax=Dinghuibacter sp. TaxID=2024697 RepID=UPI002C898FA3|nr:alkaline phosphatase family protein [Dinghuibacter sp.]HTJ11283.1 alkaline phosphatase family protein [Dinghuibacter sp.]